MLDETRVPNISSQSPWIDERSARALGYVTQMPSINKAVGVHKGQVYSRIRRITRALHRTATALCALAAR